VELGAGLMDLNSSWGMEGGEGDHAQRVDVFTHAHGHKRLEN